MRESKPTQIAVDELIGQVPAIIEYLTCRIGEVAICEPIAADYLTTALILLGQPAELTNPEESPEPMSGKPDRESLVIYYTYAVPEVEVICPHAAIFLKMCLATLTGTKCCRFTKLIDDRVNDALNLLLEVPTWRNVS